MNRLTQALARICGEKLLDEKWLVAPSRRVGYEWLESVTRSNQPVVNVRIKTFTSLAIDLAPPQMAAEEVDLLSPSGGSFLVERILRRLRATELSYLSQVELSAGLFESIFQTLNAIRSAGVAAADLGALEFEGPAKGQELRALLEAYSLEQQANRLIDHADLLRMATDVLHRVAGPDILLLVPAELEATQLEKELLEAFAELRRQVLLVDERAAAGE